MTRIADEHYHYGGFQELEFKRSVDDALVSVQRILDVDRYPDFRIAEDVDHDYTDKYKLADLLTNTAIASLMVALEGLGLTKDILLSNLNKNKNASTTLRFSATKKCIFVKSETVDIEMNDLKKVTEESVTSSKDFGTDETTTNKTTIEKFVKRVKRNHYNIEIDWELSVYSGVDVDSRQVIHSRTGTNNEYCVDDGGKVNIENSAPFPESLTIDPIEVSLTWFVQHIDLKELKSHFAIDVTSQAIASNKTKTPVRNVQIQHAFAFFASLVRWTEQVTSFVRTDICSSSIDPNLVQNLTRFDNKSNIFVPVIPLLDEKRLRREGVEDDRSSSREEEEESFVALAVKTDDDDSNGSNDNNDRNNDPNGKVATVELAAKEDESPSSSSPILNENDVASLMNEQIRTLNEVQQKLKEVYPDDNSKLISFGEANVYVLCRHMRDLKNRYVRSVQYIEHMLEKQLVAAIGKTVNSDDIDKFMSYHNEKLLNPCPKPFCYSIRRPDHYPDGILSIEKGASSDATTVYGCSASKKTMKPISTHVREISHDSLTRIPLNSATTVELTGKIYLHGWLNHRFDGDCTPTVQLTARARQFSSFVLLVGTMTNRNCMSLNDAIILRNKDEVIIPLLLNEIPTATEFKDAISSLSPEQQRFAKAFRSMQLESSVLGICVVQIKPQMEKLLNLPSNSLTKEMKLTEDLTELFVEYQVPSDLVSYDDDGSDSLGNDQVETVKKHVKSILDTIDGQKKQQIDEQTQRNKLELQKKEIKRGGQGRAYRTCHQSMKMGGLVNRSGGSLFARSSEGSQFGGSPQSPIYTPSTPAYTHAYTRTPGGFNSSSSSEPAYDLVTLDHASAPDGFAMMASSEPAAASNNLDGNKALGNNSSNSYPSSSQPSSSSSSTTPGNNNKTTSIDFNLVPKALDRAIEVNDKDSSIRSTTIETAKDGWTRSRQLNLLSKSKTESLTSNEITSEKNKAIDLLDALSRSGSLEIPFSELHVMICATHRFDKNVMETVIQDNINPIEKLELSTLIMATTIHDNSSNNHDALSSSSGAVARNLICNNNECERLASHFPRLFININENSHHAASATTTTAPPGLSSVSNPSTTEVNDCTTSATDVSF